MDQVCLSQIAESWRTPTEVALSRYDSDAHSLDDAILRTLVYADVFDYPLTSAEIHRYLIGLRASAAAIEDHLLHRDGHGARIGSISPFWFLAGRENLVWLRREREGHAERLWPAARHYGQCIATIPFVLMVALTGSLAMNNVGSPHDDIDLLIVTRNGRAWLARGLIVLLVRLARQRGIGLCPNYILSERSLALREPSLFAAHELAQMMPLYGSSFYRRLLEANAWLAGYLPNASAYVPVHVTAGPAASRGRRSLEVLLGGRLGDAVERWECERKIPRLRYEAARQGGSGATFTPDLCKGHMVDHAAVVHRQYVARLAQQGL